MRTSTGVADSVAVIVQMFGVMVLMMASTPEGTPADQLPAVFQAVLELPVQVLWAGLMEVNPTRLKMSAEILHRFSLVKYQNRLQQEAWIRFFIFSGGVYI
jgi:hypothetical protein